MRWRGVEFSSKDLLRLGRLTFLFGSEEDVGVADADAAAEDLERDGGFRLGGPAGEEEEVGSSSFAAGDSSREEESRLAAPFASRLKDLEREMGFFFFSFLAPLCALRTSKASPNFFLGGLLP